MQLWFPSSLEEPLSPTTRDSMTAQSTDPELEFDREVYPIGISIAEVAIIGQLLPKPLSSPPPPTQPHSLLAPPSARNAEAYSVACPAIIAPWIVPVSTFCFCLQCFVFLGQL